MSLSCRICPLSFASPKARASHERVHQGPTLADRLWSRVDSSAGFFACWPWTGYVREDGYGRIAVDGTNRGTHRVALELTLGRPLAAGMDACHTCDNPPCCNPAHLFEGTHLDNVADRHQKGRDARGATNGRAALTEADVLGIRRELSAGTSWSSLARAFGVSKSAIQAIAVGRTWRHVA